MTQTEKELLLKDLSARLPYGVKCGYTEGYGTLTALFLKGYVTIRNQKGYYCGRPIEDIRPYLFPLSSMTEEQREELADVELLSGEFYGTKTVDWLNAHHFDYRGLIKKSLAIDATDLNIY